ncbi:thiamine phosphate synthase [Flavobacterium cerinum]|uniref:Thiamine-phosphate synthase n=1 Tax=Flavobacterium cerinum TaxID=2502784 RepID=A0A3S3QLH2_9FLAO|nr:thiamine phosphate synthase [Flavobacterium cerinum]RWW91880.1 thiamine phosphate synthase [Flavobacterium cerinum]
MYNKIQYISQGSSIDEQLLNIEQVLDAGCEWLQLRYKNGSKGEVLQLALSVRKIIDNYNCRLIINDHPEIVKEVDADGVHLGLNDMPVAVARVIIGNDKIIGGTANTLKDVLQRHTEQCDYVGLGPFQFTTTKEKLSPIVGLEGYKVIISQLNELQVTIPVFAIGGIEQEDIGTILQTGIYGVALSGLITRHSQKKQLFNELYTLCSH